MPIFESANSLGNREIEGRKPTLASDVDCRGWKLQHSLNLREWMKALEGSCVARKLPALPSASLGRLCLHDFRSKRYQVGSRGC
jgi:hypothetical protein